MSFLQDEGAKRFYLYLTAVLAAATIFVVAIWGSAGRLLEETILDHDRAVASSLLEQGVSETVTARAFAQKTADGDGRALLDKIGIGEETDIVDMPHVLLAKREMLPLLWGLVLLLWVGILSGAGCFLSAREKLYERAVGTVERFMEGDFSEHLPCVRSGNLYRMFGRVDHLANALAARNEEVTASRNFLKGTICDISHQLKTPLSALVMYNEIITQEPENVQTVTEFSQKTTLALQRIDLLIQSLLKITRLDAGAVAFEKQTWPLAEVALRAAQELWVRAKAEKKEILFQGEESSCVCCDLQWTGEAVENLIKNALDHTSEGGRIAVSWEELPDMARIRVSDDGEGIAEEDFYHIFKRFYRSKGAWTDRRGVGLGLSLAKSIAQGQGGTLSAESEAGVGSVFTMTFPKTGGAR